MELRETMILAVASGKGGTGKTTFSVNLAWTLSVQGKKVRLLDCDAEEPNDHLFVNPIFTDERPVTVLKPQLDEAKCIGCGNCAKACSYNAMAMVKNKVLIFNELCHSCGVCSFVCPTGALTEVESSIGKVQVAADNEPFFFAHGVLDIGEALAPTVVASVKKYIKKGSVNILDASPGTACPVVKALENTDVAVLVTEPTPFGLHDLSLAMSMTLEMGIPTGIIVNRSDGKDKIIQDYANSIGVKIVGRIPFKREYAETYSSGHLIAEKHPEFAENLLAIYEEVTKLKGAVVPPVPKLEGFALSPPPYKPFDIGSADKFKEVTVISGKGGTGKTTVTAAFADLAEGKVLADNDVDAADLHLLLTPEIREAHPFVGGSLAGIDPKKCTACGLCHERCHFDAIDFDGPANDKHDKTYKVDTLSCEGCGLCVLVCPEQAITIERKVTGNWYVSNTDRGPMTHARLGIAEENSGRLVSQVRTKAAELAESLKMGQILGDGPPGTGCPVIASVTGADMVVIVTEPTVSGVHDMERVMELASHFNVPTLVIINKADINIDHEESIAEIASKNGSEVIGKIPFDVSVNTALTEGKTLIEFGESPASASVRSAWETLLNRLNQKN
ncbi:MAG: P-loop NTPase [Lentisphaerae bacterium]|nr:P-loop NTPase [Lentisphaerota bacterium]